MFTNLILFVLPAVAFGKITVKLFGNFDPSVADMVVEYDGSDTSLISDKDRLTFQMLESNLKYSALQQFGKTPDFTYTRSPIFWGDMYQINNWTQVAKIVSVSSAKILKVSAEPQIVVQRVFENNSTVPVTYDVDISHVVDTMVTSTWVNNAGLTVDAAITYDFKLELLNTKGITSMSITSSWGADTHMKHTVDSGSASTVKVPVQPGKTVTAEFHALTATVSVLVNYVASVVGDVVAHYDPEYKAHKFWELPVTKALAIAGLPDHVTAQEVMHITSRSHSKLIISDKSNLVKMTEVDV